MYLHNYIVAARLMSMMYRGVFLFFFCFFFVLFFFICLTALLSVVIAQTPGDGDSFCTNTSPGVAPQVYPVNARILMDSFNYIRLLSTQSGAVWQQVDVDNSSSRGRGATVSEVDLLEFYFQCVLNLQWFQSADNPCRQVVTACGLEMVSRITG